jgi:hypothetical protein
MISAVAVSATSTVIVCMLASTTVEAIDSATTPAE